VSSAVTEAKLWYWQRVSAMALAFFVLVHLATMIYAVQGGLGAAEILGRTRGSWLFGGFYSVFVVAAAVHSSIGLAAITREWFGWKDGIAHGFGICFAIFIAVTGLRAVFGVVIG